ncbi:hypothetical protein PYJP_06370 [Pyrofollis japonicus]|uniref:type III-B CRISPR module RAMP protein Cmr6 n=1 Tax=Pyrofollis japonicus TaxID=3060460 RepID=UPI00295A7953|nr:type III-B CRISPR module RAMP protein Cmr6 [Pyrofollis japonicus]BEP17285.1 hypothetical protein PYJP_06370 [Pyrofollis japonicus]
MPRPGSGRSIDSQAYQELIRAANEICGMMQLLPEEERRRPLQFCGYITELLSSAPSLRNSLAQSVISSRTYFEILYLVGRYGPELRQIARKKLHPRDRRRLEKNLNRVDALAKRAVAELLAESSSIARIDESVGKALSYIREHTLRALRSLGYRVITLRAHTVTRLIVGKPPINIDSVFEYGTALHPVLGIPYIPASSIKGAFRAFIETSGYTCNTYTLEEFVAKAFGSKEGKGSIIFTDAFPIPQGRGLLIELDVTTPIYGDGSPDPRIREHEARPVPVIYPTVARGLRFFLAIGLGPSIGNECMKAVTEWVSKLFVEGIGAKTTLSYGVLQPNEIRIESD